MAIYQGCEGLGNGGSPKAAVSQATLTSLHGAWQVYSGFYVSPSREKRSSYLWDGGAWGSSWGEEEDERLQVESGKTYFSPFSESLKGEYSKDCEHGLALEMCISNELSFAHGPSAGKPEAGMHPLQVSSAGTNVAAVSGPSYGCSRVSPMASPCKTQGPPGASAEAETLLWCRRWCWPSPRQPDCSSSSREKQSLAKVMRWRRAHYANTVWATFIIPHHEPCFHEWDSLAPLDNLNCFWHEGFFSYFMTYFPSII